MAKKKPYTPIKSWFDLSLLDLPVKKFNHYADLQRLGEQYQKTIQYQKKYNNHQLDNLKSLCAEMQYDLITNYGALEAEKALAEMDENNENNNN